ncbi:T9SS type A sorting domain-containing protein [bacterium]|nr:T9SS type A sorting domain-containing protein [bacterium]
MSMPRTVKSNYFLSKFAQTMPIFAVVLFVFSMSSIGHAQSTKWVATWATSPYEAENNTPPKPYLANNTLRQIVRVSIGGDTLRVKFSNRTSPTPVTINSANIAVSTDSSTSVIDSTTITPLAFNGDTSVTMDAYTEAMSDPFAFALEPGMHLAITIYYGQCEISAEMTFHYGSRTYSYILEGDQTESVDFADAKKVERWYTLSLIDVLAPEQAAAIGIIGNSITDGYGIHNGGDKWPDSFSRKLLANPQTAQLSALNLGIGATLVSTSGVSRFQKDVLDQAGLRWAIVFYGVNDIGANEPASTVINAFRTLISQAHAQNIRIYGATITPFKGHGYYTVDREAVRQEVNEWIRTPGHFDKVIDFDELLRDPDDPEKMLKAYASDYLHPNLAGYKFLGESVDLNLFLGADTTYEHPDLSNMESHYFEAECGTVGADWQIIRDASASHAHYISVFDGTESLESAATESLAEFPFTITRDSTYYLYARLNCPTYDDDSFWIQVDDGAFTMVNSLVTSGWQWVQLDSFDLASGEHILNISYREDGAKLDKICLTNYLGAPVGMGEEAENECTVTAVEEKSEIPTYYSLDQNYPNPFNPITHISYSIPENTHVTLAVFNALGQQVAQVVNREQTPGSYIVRFDGSDLATGAYVYQLKAGEITMNKKFTLLK